MKSLQSKLELLLHQTCPIDRLLIFFSLTLDSNTVTKQVGCVRVVQNKYHRHLMRKNPIIVTIM